MNSKTFNFSVSSHDSDNNTFTFLGAPEDCPDCKRGQNFFHPIHARAGINQIHCYALYQCVFSDCRAAFLADYIRQSSNKFSYTGNSIPRFNKPIEEIPSVIDKISPKYREIYSQAHEAEQKGLDLIAGCGYRKALEFLIKDYAISLLKGEKEDEALTEEEQEKIGKIIRSQLGTVINNYLEIPKVKALAARATWLGNDETHYERRLETGDISVMKNLMSLTILFIESEEIAKKLEIEIQPVK